ncbi:MAG: TraR/DksA family transcriptional regulator [Endomicrobia bacterium]|nr:TraR/DksA family transcriptional regulator [Endomicrobiia bacterium]
MKKKKSLNIKKYKVKQKVCKKAEISEKELEYYKKKLIEKYNELMKLHKTNNIELPTDIGDEIDMAEHNLDRELRRELSDTQINLLNLINAALEKIEKKEYGICSKCGEKIPKKRLETLPWTDLCIKCQKFTEEEKIY